MGLPFRKAIRFLDHYGILEPCCLKGRQPFFDTCPHIRSPLFGNIWRYDKSDRFNGHAQFPVIVFFLQSPSGNIGYTVFRFTMIDTISVLINESHAVIIVPAFHLFLGKCRQSKEYRKRNFGALIEHTTSGLDDHLVVKIL